MNGFFRLLLLLPLLCLTSCQEETSREEARIRREVDQRVEAIRTEMKVSEHRWRTIRTVTLCLLAGGSLIWLFNGGGTVSPRGRYPSLADNGGYETPNRRRVIDRPYPDPDDEPGEHPYRR